MPDNESEFEEESGNGWLSNALWYLTLIIGIGLLVLYWRTFIEVNSIILSLEPWFPKVTVAFLTIFIANLFIKITSPLLKKAYFVRHGKLEKWKVVKMAYSYIIWMFTILVILSGVFGTISSFGLSLGIIGAGLAFALQQPILSFSGFFLIMLKRPFGIGDRILLNSEGLYGDVEEISMFFFVLKEVTAEDSPTARSIIVPNSAVFHGSIVNYSYDTPYIWQKIVISVPYESNIRIGEKIIYNATIKVVGNEMRKAARQFKRKFPESVQTDIIRERPRIRIDFADSSINITTRYVCLPKQSRLFKTQINKEIHRVFNLKRNREKVSFAYPHMEVVAHESFKKTFTPDEE